MSLLDGRTPLAVAMVLVVLSSIVPRAGTADVRMRLPTPLPAPPNPADGVVADLDADGLADVAMCDGSSDSLLVLWGHSGGPPYSTTGSHTGAVATLVRAGDVDRDGRTDLVLGAPRSAQIITIRGLGGRAFAPPRPCSTGAPFDAFRLADVSGDGVLDVLVLTFDDSPWAQTLLMLCGVGDGSFSDPETLGVNTNRNVLWRWLATGDFDGDGREDVAIGRVSLPPLVMFADEGGFVSREVPLAQGVSLQAADLDLDGRSDLLVSESFGDSLQVLYGRSDRGFDVGPETPWMGVDPDAPGDPLVVADLDGNGWPDVATATSGGDCYEQCQHVWISRGIGSRSFLGAENFAFDHGESYDDARVSAAGAGDLDGDGDLDLVVVASNVRHLVGSRTVELKNDGVGAFLAPYNTAPLPFTPRRLLAARFDRSRPADLLSARPGIVVRLRNDGHGRLGPPEDLVPGDPLEARDLDRDGVDDLLVNNGGTLTLYRGDGAGGVGPAEPLGPWTWAGNGSFDAPHGLDLVVRGSGDSLLILSGRDHGRFKRPRLFGLAELGYFQPSVADVDGDGLDDLLWISCGPDGSASVEIGLNRRGQLELPVSVPLPPDWLCESDHSQPWRVVGGDLDGDGRCDLVVGSSLGPGAAPLLVGWQDPDGTYVFANPSDSGALAAIADIGGLETRDLDGDERLEALAVNKMDESWGRLCVLSFPAPRDPRSLPRVLTLPLEHYPVALAVADLDGDGRPDLAAGNLMSRTITVIRNAQGEGTKPTRGFVAQPVAGEEPPPASACAQGLTLEMPHPQPVIGDLVVSFVLPGPGRGRIDLLDLAGRRMRSCGLSDLTPGPHRQILAAAGTVAPGVYVVRLAFGGAVRSARVAVLR